MLFINLHNIFRRFGVWLVMATICLGNSALQAQIFSKPNTLYRIAGGTFGAKDGTGSDAQFGGMYGITRNVDGNLYSVDYSNHSVRKITPDGVVSTFAGISGIPGSVDGLGSAARFYQPVGITSDQAGTMYVSDTYNHTIRRITLDGNVSTIAGTPGVVGSIDGVGSTAQFNTPHGITIGQDGNLYVADFWNHSIRKITPAGIVSTLAGASGIPGNTDGEGNTAHFSRPTGITSCNGKSNLYAVDRHNHTIREISLSGVVRTLAGTGTPGSTDGVGNAAQFYFPFGITCSDNGNLYISDTLNYTIRKITSDAVVTTVVGIAGTAGSSNYPSPLPGLINAPEGIGMVSKWGLAFSNAGAEILGANFEANVPPKAPPRR